MARPASPSFPPTTSRTSSTPLFRTSNASAAAAFDDNPLDTSTTTTKARQSQTPPPAVAVSLLQPRVAVALGVPRHWHHTLYACRLFSTVPAVFWGLRFALRFLVTEFLLWTNHGSSRPRTSDQMRDSSLRLVETALAMIWCLASSYLAFFFTDCLMSRWLINYTAQATVIRLVTISCGFWYSSSWVVYLTGGSHSPSLLLSAWVGIATILTACYHFTQRKIRIRKETFASISIFSIASFISMIALLSHSHYWSWTQREETMGNEVNGDGAGDAGGGPDIPLVALVRRACEIIGHIVVDMLGVKVEYGV
ncbi:N-glycosylation protein-domain-containing protein [Xylariomycetidae sp. FL2044]|nr:N-glycosylation protein-domain-containing protein [Xylariomycetidae sp. FL2044]